MNRRTIALLAVPAISLFSINAVGSEPDASTGQKANEPTPIPPDLVRRTPVETEQKVSPVKISPAPPPAPPPRLAPPPPAPPPPASPYDLLPELPKGSNVIIYRANAQPTIWASTVKINGKKLAALGNKKWTATTLEPGTYEVKIGWSFMSGQSGGKYTLTVEEGRTHYLEIVGRSEYAGGYGAGGMMFNMGSGIGEVRGAGALRRVASCCTYKEPN